MRTKTAIFLCFYVERLTESGNKHQSRWESLSTEFGITLLPATAESVALAKYLSVEEGGKPRANLLACDVGGSTSDIAIWADDKLVGSDSVRFAGDILSRLFITDEESRKAIIKAFSSLPWKNSTKPHIKAFVSALDLSHGVGLLDLNFNHMLRGTVEEFGSTIKLATALNTGKNTPGERVLSHAGYMFASLSFLMGLMARREGILHDHYDLRFGGRGGSFLSWVDALDDNAAQELCKSFFGAGLGDSTVSVEVSATQKPKEEVGRGLLYETASVTTPTDRVTFFGDTILGKQVPWEKDFGYDSFKSLDLSSLSRRPISEYEKLCDFISAFKLSSTGKRIAFELNLSDSVINDKIFRDSLYDDLFGSRSMFSKLRSVRTETEAMLEPLLMQEIRSLLSHVTGNAHLFDHLR